MDRRTKLLIGATIAGVVAAGALWGVQRWHKHYRDTPSWTDPEQPPEGTAGLAASFGVSTRSAAWCAARPGDPGLRSGSRIMRSYAATLADDPESMVR